MFVLEEVVQLNYVGALQLAVHLDFKLDPLRQVLGADVFLVNHFERVGLPAVLPAPHLVYEGCGAAAELADNFEVGQAASEVGLRVIHFIALAK